MKERIYQLRLDTDTLKLVKQNVTPDGFTGLTFPYPKSPERLGRFVREASASTCITSPQEAGNYLLQHVYHPFEDFDQEEMWVLLLNSKNWITHEAMIYRGTVNTVFVRVAEFFKEAVRVNAKSLILSHIHPSGNPEPSPEDVRVTQAVNQAAQVLDVELLDHLVIGKDCWVSLKERGLGFE